MDPLSPELLARVVALAADAIICVNADQTITFFNEGASQIFGYSRDEILGKSLDVLIPAQLREVHRAHINAFSHSSVTARQMGDRSPVSGVRKNGEQFPAEAAIARIIGPDGAIYSVLLRDVTHQRRAEALNRKLLSDTEAAVKARDEVLGLVSHDLRNPVNAVKMLAAAILRTAPETHETDVSRTVMEHASVMLQAANQMDALIQDLLDVTRIESGRMHLSQTDVALSDVLGITIATMLPLAQDQGVRVVVQLPEDTPRVYADPDRLVQLLSNLISNAIKFSRRDGAVRVSVRADEAMVKVSIVDEGVGIAANELPMVFDRFWQSKRTNRSGAGLGLAIARGIVRAHGGDISITSAINEGTSVVFTLPAVRVSHPAP